MTPIGSLWALTEAQGMALAFSVSKVRLFLVNRTFHSLLTKIKTQSTVVAAGLESFLSEK